MPPKSKDMAMENTHKWVENIVLKNLERSSSLSALQHEKTVSEGIVPCRILGLCKSTPTPVFRQASHTLMHCICKMAMIYPIRACFTSSMAEIMSAFSSLMM